MLKWTRKKEWGSEGMTHRADLDLGGDSYHFQVRSPYAGHWTMSVWKRDGTGKVRHDKAVTMRDAKALAEDYVTELESSARAEASSTIERANAIVAAARARVQFRKDTCGCRTPLHTMRCGVGGVVSAVAR